MINRLLKATCWAPILVVAVAINLFLYGAMSQLSRKQENNRITQYDKPILLTMPEKRPPIEKRKRKPLKKKSLKMKKMENPLLKQQQVVKPPQFEFGTPAGGLAVTTVFTPQITQNLPSFKAPRTLFNLSELDQKPRLLYRADPIYPYNAKRRNLSGKLVLQFIVDNNGNVGNIEVIQADPKGVFDQSAIQAVQKWRFKPGIYQGEAVSTRVIVPINFQI